MRLNAAVGMMWFAGTIGFSAEIAQGPKRLTVYVDNRSHAPLALVGRSQSVAARTFASIGVRIDWRFGAPPTEALSREHPVVMTITENTPAAQYSGEFASAQAFEGIHLRILYDRLRWAESWPKLAPMLLAHVMVHEITHLVQGLDRHSPSGIMKARLTQDDFQAIERGLPQFEPEVRLIHLGLNHRSRRFKASPAEPGNIAQSDMHRSN